MSTPTPGERAVSLLQISDVFLVESNCWVDREFNQTQQFTEILYGHQSGPEPQCFMQTRTPVNGGEPIHILRYFIHGEIRFLKPGTELAEGSEPKKENLLALLKFVIATDYQCPAESLADKDAVGSFGRNAHFHAWPYLREEVHAACSRLRIPRITLPMFKPEHGSYPTVDQITK